MYIEILLMTPKTVQNGDCIWSIGWLQIKTVQLICPCTFDGFKGRKCFLWITVVIISMRNWKWENVFWDVPLYMYVSLCSCSLTMVVRLRSKGWLSNQRVDKLRCGLIFCEQGIKLKVFKTSYQIWFKVLQNGLNVEMLNGQRGA